MKRDGDDVAARHIAELISGFGFWAGWRRRSQFEDDVAAAVERYPDECYAVGMPEVRAPVAARRAGAAVILGRLVEATQERFAADVEQQLVAALDSERSIKAAEELGRALGRAWIVLDKPLDVAMAYDSRPAYRLTAALNLALLAESPEDFAALQRLLSD